MSTTLMPSTAATGADGGADPPVETEVLDVTARARRHRDYGGHQRVLEIRNPARALHGFIAIHDTTLGPALGGCRMWPYPSPAAALRDALRLSRGMTLKAALADLELGGGKTTLIGDPKSLASEPLFCGLGAVIEGLGGAYVTGEDVGTSPREMDWVAKETAHVIGTTSNGGDPSGMTALGVSEGIRAAVRHRLGADGLAGITVAVQGLGHVGRALCRRLKDEGAALVVADLDSGRVADALREFDAAVVDPDDIYGAEADVFAPCALGDVLNDRTVPALRCAVVAGSANNQLAAERHADALRDRGILYAPDYVINAGGLISFAYGLRGEEAAGPAAWAQVSRIGATLAEIFARAEAEDTTPSLVADRIAIERIARRRHKV